MFNVIPAIDILNGNCVRLSGGDYSASRIYDTSPVAIALKWQELGAKRLHVVDLDGARSGQPVNAEIIKEIARRTNCQIGVGGGIRSLETIKDYLDSGVRYVILGSIIFKDPALLKKAIKMYGEHLIAGVDLKNGTVKVSGWLEDTGDTGVSTLKKLESLGIQTAIITDISKDGMLSGPAFSLYKELTKGTDIRVIASGGITKLEDIRELKTIKGVTGCIIGKALYEGTLDIQQALALQE